MSTSLHSESFMECPCHGRQKPAFICQHLLRGELQGFLQPNDIPTTDEPWEMAWCEACEVVRMRTGGWNDESEGYAGVQCICHGCFETARARNSKHDMKVGRDDTAIGCLGFQRRAAPGRNEHNVSLHPISKSLSPMAERCAEYLQVCASEKNGVSSDIQT